MMVSIPQEGLVDKYWYGELLDILQNMLCVDPHLRRSALSILKWLAFHYELQSHDDPRIYSLPLNCHPLSHGLRGRGRETFPLAIHCAESSWVAILEYSRILVCNMEQGLHLCTLSGFPRTAFFWVGNFSKGRRNIKFLAVGFQNGLTL